MSDLLPSPVDMGLPSRYSAWRAFQDEAVTNGITSEARFVVQSMPTGSGKSLVCVAQAVATGARVAYLTSTKGLQDQVLKDFAECGAVDIRGKKNYGCLEEDHPAKCLYMHSMTDEHCEYNQAIQAARNSQLVVTNYSLWLNSMRYSGKKTILGKFDMLILDEGHNAPAELASFLGFEITRYQCRNLLQEDSLPYIKELEGWQEWGHSKMAWLKEEIEHLENVIAAGYGDQTKTKAIRSAMKQVDKLEEFRFTLLKLLKLDPSLWVHERHKDSHVTFDIINPATEAEGSLFSYADYHYDPLTDKFYRVKSPVPKVLLVSATVRPKTCEMLGIEPQDMDFQEYPHTFPVHTRRVMHIPTVKLTYRSSQQDLKFWVNRMDQIISQRLDRKGIIHTVSYKRMQFILEHSKHADLLITHATGERDWAIQTFKESKDPCVLVSPSVTTGFDFPYDQCEYQIIGKIPWPSTQSEIVKARNLMDPDHLNYLAMQDLIQAAGRGSRALDDQCEIFVIDDQMAWFPWKFKAFAPEWFLESITKTSSLPRPPAALLRNGT